MKHIFELFEKIEATSKRTEKEKLLKEFEDKQNLFEILKYVYDPYLMFYISKFDDDNIYREDVPTQLEFIEVLNKLSERIITGHAARDLVRSSLLTKDDLYRKWMSRILNKDLQAGLGVKTINKVFDNLIPEFELGLCETFEYTRGETVDLPVGSFWMEPKLDGFRCAIFLKDNQITFLSRNNKPLFNTRLIEEDFYHINEDNIVLDGEIMADDWNDTASIVMSEEEHEKIGTLHFYCFDILTIDEWNNKTSAPYEERKQKLLSILNNDNIKHIHPVKCISCSLLFNQAQKDFDKYRKEGSEGVILKRLNSEYPFGRGKDWIKWKEFITVDVIIKEAVLGTGKNKERLGAFICDYNGKDVRVGSGFSDEERVEFWANKDSMIGLLIEIKTQECTRDGSLRFPTFLRIRKDLN
jgi:DNA ligase-1